ncbi:MAG: DUF2780 domain-containing protein [Planctomycetaceae bacterium]
MDELISQLTARLGIGEDVSKNATGSLLKMLQDQLDDSTFGEVLKKLPGAQGLIDSTSEASQETSSGGGLFGSLASMAGGLLGGGSKGGLGELAAMLSKSGLGLTQVTGFMNTVIAFLKEKLGSDLFATVAAKLPELMGGSSESGS